MKIQCNSILEAPIINIIKLHQSLNTSGVCGIITDGSKYNVKETTIGSLTLLSYCNELEVVDSFKDKLRLIDITVRKGGISYSSIAESSEGLLVVPSNLDDTPFAMTSNDISFRLLIGTTTSEDVLLEQDLYNYCTGLISEEQVFTPVPMPLLSKKLLQFDVKREEGKSIISCADLPDSILTEVISTVKMGL